LATNTKKWLKEAGQYFERCVEALQAKDEERAKIYASEIAEIRKLAGICASQPACAFAG
jgi:division protein CdvB (Snf7/Vps24/ESCRT-III family)